MKIFWRGVFNNVTFEGQIYQKYIDKWILKYSISAKGILWRYGELWNELGRPHQKYIESVPILAKTHRYRSFFRAGCWTTGIIDTDQVSLHFIISPSWASTWHLALSTPLSGRYFTTTCRAPLWQPHCHIPSETQPKKKPKINYLVWMDILHHRVNAANLGEEKS